MFNRVFLFLPITRAYRSLTMFTRVNLFAHVYVCSPLFARACSHTFTHVYSCSPMFTRVYLCLPMLIRV